MEQHAEARRFSHKPPDVAVSYMWLGSPLMELVDELLKAFGEDSLVWLDIVFNDQRSTKAVGNAVSLRKKGQWLLGREEGWGKGGRARTVREC